MIDAKEFLKIKKLALISLVSDDILIDKLVLKGGTCLELAYKIHCRSSKDIDFSIDNEFSDGIAFGLTNEELEDMSDDITEVIPPNMPFFGIFETGETEIKKLVEI